MTLDTPPRRGPGRPRKFNDDVLTKIRQAVEIGLLSPYRIAAHAGISYDLYNDWTAGRGLTKAEYDKFHQTIKSSEANRDMRALARITAAMPKHWQAAAWILERTSPELYGRTVQEQQGRVDHRHSGNVAHAHRDMTAFTDDEMVKLGEVAEGVQRRIDSARVAKS